MNTPSPFAETTVLPQVSRRRGAHAASKDEDEITPVVVETDSIAGYPSIRFWDKPCDAIDELARLLTGRPLTDEESEEWDRTAQEPYG